MPSALQGLVALCASLLLAGCGHGQATQSRSVSHVTLRDARDDLWIMFAHDPAPTTPNGDAVGAVLTRTAHELVVTVRYTDIEPRANHDWGVELALDIPNDQLERQVAWSEYQFADTRGWDREADYTRASSEDSLGQRCSGLRGEPDFKAETVTLHVPDRCFRSAPWVVVEGLSATTRSRGSQHAADFVGTDGAHAGRTPRLVEPG